MEHDGDTPNDEVAHSRGLEGRKHPLDPTDHGPSLLRLPASAGHLTCHHVVLTLDS